MSYYVTLSWCQMLMRRYAVLTGSRGQSLLFFLVVLHASWDIIPAKFCPSLRNGTNLPVTAEYQAFLYTTVFILQCFWIETHVTVDAIPIK